MEQVPVMIEPYPILIRKECSSAEHREAFHSDDNARPGIWFVMRVPVSFAVSVSTVNLSDFCAPWTKEILSRCLGIACSSATCTQHGLKQRRV